MVEVFGATYGSGYAINDRMVLTARHLLAVDGIKVAPGKPVMVRVAGEENGRRATVTWVSKDVGDAALLSVEGAPWADAPDAQAVRWGRVTDDGPVPCRAWGFPAAQASARGDQEIRDIEEMHGAVKPLTASMRYEIDVRSAAPMLTDDEHSPWRGMSGAVLMDSRKRILGVVIANRLRYGGQRLQAAPAERLFTDPEFCEQAAVDSSRLETVGAEDAVLLDAPGARPILRTVHSAAPRLDGLSDYQLLQARFRAVDFLGREDERHDLRAWCTADEPVSLGLVAGAGGAGKTRLGIQLCRELAERGWSTGFADEQVLDAALGANKVVDVVWPTLLILDYPDRLTDRIIEWIENMGERRFGPRLRFLLLDRVPGDSDDRADTARTDLTWWANAKRITRSDFIARPRVVVHLRTGGLTGTDRSQHLESARRAFGGGNADLSGLDLTDDAYRNPLKVHVAALLAIRGEFYPTAAQVMSRFLDREKGRWLQQRNKHGIGNISPPLAHQIVALATLTRPEIDVVPRLLSAIPDLADPADTGSLLRPNVRNWLTEQFGVGSRISAIEPDLLAEELLGTTPDLDRIVVSIYRHEASTAEHAASMLEALSLAAGGRASVRGALLHFLAKCLGSLVAQAAEEPDGRLPGLIEIALTQFWADENAVAVLAVAAAGIRRVPHPQDSYRQLMSRLVQLATAWCDAQPPHVQTAQVRVDALTDMAAEAAISSGVTEATALAGEALDVCRRLGPEESRRLARAWYNLGTCHANSGDLQAAREALSTAAAVSRQGMGEDTDVLIERCETLVNLGSCLADLDDQAAALGACVEAIELRIGRDYAGHVLEPLVEPLALLAESLRESPGPRGSLGDPRPFRPLGWSEPEHQKWSSSHSFVLITLVARLSTGLADRVAPHIRALPADEAQAKATALSDALHRLTGNLFDSLSGKPLIESIELRRLFVTDDWSRAEFAKYLSTVAEELGDADLADEALACANDSIAEFQQLGPEQFAQYEGDFGNAVLVKAGALTLRGTLDPLQLIHGELQQSVTAELDEADLLLRNLPETPQNAPVLAAVSAMRGVHLLLTGDTDGAGEALARAGERYAATPSDSGESFEDRVIPHLLVELLAGRQPYGWLTSLSDSEVLELDPEALPLLDQAMLSEAEEIGEFLDLLASALVAADRLDIALDFANQSVELARFWMRFEQDSDPDERSEIRMSLSRALTNLSGIPIGTPEDALRYAREAVDVIASVPEDELLLPLIRGSAEVALARASLAGDPHADVVGIAESATTDLARAVHSITDEIAESGSYANSVSMTVMRAEALVILANAYLAVNRHSEAIDQALVARDLLLRLPQTKPVVALVLTTRLAEGQGELAFGRYDSALAAFDQVIEAYEVSDLAPSSPAGLAEAAFMAAICLQELGQPEQAVQKSRLAMELWRSPELRHGPAALQGRVAANLVVQAIGLTMLGDLDEAYRVSLEAVVAAREVPHAAVSLVSALRVHANCMAGLGRFAEAVSLFDEAMAVVGPAEGQEVPLIERGLVKLGYGNCQAELGQIAVALDAFLEAAAIFRAIPGQTPVLAGTLIFAARCHRELGRNLAGLPLLVEAVGRCRELIVDQGSAAGLADVLTGALWEMVVCQETAANGVAADAAATEGIDFFRTWGLSQRGEVTQATLHHADMLTYHFGFLAEYGRELEALPFCVEATGILRNLAGINPQAFVPAFLNSLAGQVELLRRLGRHAEAAIAESEYARWAPRLSEE
ncbi:trypsin-like peptidase domain-containing protein [Streptomyces sp. NPDC060065]|uniref:trypsin-like peptidase domain-containing protein n=1 Tax=Streptomyces sp. NPDC060065 TaxID=3347050 RepID=UPI0036CAE492